MNLFKFLQREKEDLEFIDMSPRGVYNDARDKMPKGDPVVYPHYPIMLAKDVKTVMQSTQEKKYGNYNFPICPGMHDYSRLGYIIPAWTNFHIKANKAGGIALTGTAGEDREKRATPIPQPARMDPNIAAGLFEVQDGIPVMVWNFPGAWKISAPKNLSALIMPAFYHSKFLDDIYVYPGVVDYHNFYTTNFICSPKRKCEIEIKAGEPLLHVIPFYTHKTIVASYGPGDRETRDATRLIPFFHDKNFYRKFYMIKKKFKLFKKVPE